MGATGTGKCACSQGFTGALCSEECPGGVSTPCTGHGVCLGDGTCRCMDDDFGHWAGKDCSICASEWYGSNCNQQCPKKSGLLCGGHGVCGSDVACRCDETSERGYWRLVDGVCSECKEGFYGPACKLVCPGPLCNPCSGHGICSDGLDGTGTCSCYQSNQTAFGYWSGADCSECSMGFWGPKCVEKCQTFDDAVVSAATALKVAPVYSVAAMQLTLEEWLCGPKGRCSGGLAGTGRCICEKGWRTSASQTMRAVRTLVLRTAMPPVQLRSFSRHLC